MSKTDATYKKVTLELSEHDVPLLLGALRLGIWTEDWCAALCQTEINSYNTHSGKWILRVGHIIDEIKKQSGINKENKEYGECKGMLEQIDQWVAQQCHLNEKSAREREAAEYQEHLERLKIDETYRKENKAFEEKMSAQAVSVPLTGEMISKAKQWVSTVQAEKC